ERAGERDREADARLLRRPGDERLERRDRGARRVVVRRVERDLDRRLLDAVEGLEDLDGLRVLPEREGGGSAGEGGLVAVQQREAVVVEQQVAVPVEGRDLAVAVLRVEVRRAVVG